MNLVDEPGRLWRDEVTLAIFRNGPGAWEWDAQHPVSTVSAAAEGKPLVMARVLGARPEAMKPASRLYEAIKRVAAIDQGTGSTFAAPADRSLGHVRVRGPDG